MRRLNRGWSPTVGDLILGGESTALLLGGFGLVAAGDRVSELDWAGWTAVALMAPGALLLITGAASFFALFSWRTAALARAWAVGQNVGLAAVALVSAACGALVHSSTVFAAAASASVAFGLLAAVLRSQARLLP